MGKCATLLTSSLAEDSREISHLCCLSQDCLLLKDEQHLHQQRRASGVVVAMPGCVRC